MYYFTKPRNHIFAQGETDTARFHLTYMSVISPRFQMLTRMESKQFLFWQCAIASIIVSSVSIEMKAEKCMKKHMPFVIACDIGLITQNVSFYNNDEKAVSCVPPGQPCGRMAIGCSLSKDNSTALLVIDAVDCKKDSGDWYCKHGTDISSKFKMECSQCGHCNAFAWVTLVISCILVLCSATMVIVNIIVCCRKRYSLPEGKLEKWQKKKCFKWFCFIMEMASAIMGTVGAIGLPMLCEMDEVLMHVGMVLDISSVVLGIGLMIYEFAKSQSCQTITGDNRPTEQEDNVMLRD